jgi:2-C-methyl-D-erythritol 4-phosphate cytidylyltransferase
LSIFALIPAAGSGSRSAGTEPKQYRELAGKPMLWHAIRAVCVPRVQSVFVVLAPGDERFAREDWSAFAGRVQPLYCGGASRRDSVYNGLVAMSASVDPDDWVLVHDAARPCLGVRDVQGLMRECEADEIGGLLALPAADTVKQAAKDEAGAVRVAATLDRSQLWLAQTPQMFRVALLMQALQRAPATVTDEAAAIEALGLRPRLVAGRRDNLKVTYPEDFAVAESILARRRSA